MTSCEERADRLALVNAGLASSSDLIGCSDTEIAHVEENAGKRLPGSYLVFLRKFGKSAGRLMADVDVFYDSMIGLTDVAKEFVDSCERGTLCLPENAYVFAMGHSAAWIVFFHLGFGSGRPTCQSSRKIEERDGRRTKES
ncbi:MAG: hypothetical protein KatS3mg105_3790 [Gemmatales bacterium]|nr:MAG: hypothetical protein KatS3mg105_3790 [Gemmatales bacterium]